MSHAAITQKDGSTESITEFNGGVKMELNQRASMTMEVFVLNKNMSVFFSMVPKLYFILPWQLRLIPKSAGASEQPDAQGQDSDSESEEIDEEQ
mmetsp:Transcript_9963/g.12458  ORF Transcript_9963/g.12458 Transcript_9963/m.12458 type:complete len:94 (-) Transcript_9963:1462-1743(-)